MLKARLNLGNITLGLSNSSHNQPSKTISYKKISVGHRPTLQLPFSAERSEVPARAGVLCILTSALY
jgi:hypothetical protein